MVHDNDHKNAVRYDIKQVVKLFENGSMPSQIAVQLDLSLNEVLEALERHRRANEPSEMAKKTI